MDARAADVTALDELAVLMAEALLAEARRREAAGERDGALRRVSAEFRLECAREVARLRERT